MKAILSIPYTGPTDDASFQVNDDYYKDNEYIDALHAEYSRSADAVAQLFDEDKDMKHKQEKTDNIQNKNTATNADHLQYVTCSAVLLDENMKDETIDGIIAKYVRQQPFAEIFKVNMDAASSDFIYEWQLWNMEHVKLHALVNDCGEDWVLCHEPLRDLKISFANHASETITMDMYSCRIIGKIDSETYVITTMNTQINNSIIHKK